MIEIINSSPNRWDISEVGWRRMNAGRSAAHLMREAVSNAFDTDDVTEIRMRIEPGFMSIEDNSNAGIVDPNLVTTIFLTNKEDSHTKRGRKGLGIKELISTAEWAEVDTAGYKIIFDDGRKTYKSDRKSGTKVSVKNSTWTQEDVDKAVLYLQRTITPENIKFYINDVQIKRKKLRVSFQEYLQTQIIREGVQIEDHKNTTISIFNLIKGEKKGWVYEMGIPVQEIGTPFHIDIAQRIPLNNNRDTVSGYFLSTIYTAYVKTQIAHMSAGMVRQDWVLPVLDYLPERVQKQCLEKLFGSLDKLCVQSDNPQANDIAKQHGYRVLDNKSMTKAVEIIAKNNLKSTIDIATRLNDETKSEPVPNSVVPGAAKLAKLVQFLGKNLIFQPVETGFFRRERDFTGIMRFAHFRRSHNGSVPKIEFNVASDLQLDNPLHAEILSTIVHELAHHHHTEHNNLFAEQVEHFAGRMGSLFAEYNIREIIDMPSNKPIQQSISCMDCGEIRYVCVHDAAQTRFCLRCQTKRRRKK